MNKLRFLEAWYAAAHADIGVVVETTNPRSCTQRLYQARKKAKDPTLSELSVITSPISPGNQVWIIKKHVPREVIEAQRPSV